MTKADETKFKMTTKNSIAMFAMDRLREALTKGGYSVERREQARGSPFSVYFCQTEDFMGGDDPKWSRRAQLYEKDAYPNDRDEIFLHMWTGTGMSMKAPVLASALTAAGFPARVTTHEKYLGLRVKMPGLLDDYFKHSSEK